eukprot:9629-Pelagococcus_subviridis.AAC.2
MSIFPSKFPPPPSLPTPHIASWGESSRTSFPFVPTRSARGASCLESFALNAARMTPSFCAAQSARISSGQCFCDVRPILAASSGDAAARIRSIASLAAGASAPLWATPRPRRRRRRRRRRASSSVRRSNANLTSFASDARIALAARSTTAIGSSVHGSASSFAPAPAKPSPSPSPSPSRFSRPDVLTAGRYPLSKTSRPCVERASPRRVIASVMRSRPVSPTGDGAGPPELPIIFGAMNAMT